MLIFQENTRLPVVQVSMKDLPLATLLDVLESHQFLQLPRLSSQEVFDHLCPPGNLLGGIDNCLSAGLKEVRLLLTSIFSNIFSLFELLQPFNFYKQCWPYTYGLPFILYSR